MRIVSLNTEEKPEEQAAWLDKVLTANPNRWTVLTFHRPMFSSAKGLKRPDSESRPRGSMPSDRFHWAGSPISNSRAESGYSGLLASRDTMELLRGSAGLPVPDYRCDDDLKEISFGTWEGETWKGLRKNLPGLYRERDDAW